MWVGQPVFDLRIDKSPGFENGVEGYEDGLFTVGNGVNQQKLYNRT